MKGDIISLHGIHFRKKILAYSSSATGAAKLEEISAAYVEVDTDDDDDKDTISLLSGN